MENAKILYFSSLVVFACINFPGNQFSIVQLVQPKFILFDGIQNHLPTKFSFPIEI